jgi:hypothetical protein
MSTAPSFSPAILGQTEKALNAILDRQLAGTGLTERHWITLTLTVAGGGTLDREQLADRVAGVFKFSAAQAQTDIAELAAAHLLEVPAEAGAPVRPTDAGQRLHGEIRAAVTQITERMWGDLPAEDLDTAGRVLATVLARANAELAA